MPTENIVYITFFQACLIQVIGKRWFESTRRIFRLTSVGSKVSIGEEDSAQCTICFNDFCNPIRVCPFSLCWDSLCCDLENRGT